MQQLHVHTALSACAAAIAAGIAIFILLAAHIPFPIALSPAAWAHWAMFGALVYSSHSLLMFLLGRALGQQQPRHGT